MKPVILLLALLLALPAHADSRSDEVPMYAISLIGSPYRLGGTTPETGVDCSGFLGQGGQQFFQPRLCRVDLVAVLAIAAERVGQVLTQLMILRTQLVADLDELR